MRNADHVFVLLFVQFTTVGIGYGQVPLDTSGLKGSVAVDVVDSFGGQLAGSTVYMQRRGTDGSSGSKVRLQGHQIDDLDYGSYIFTAEQRNFAPASVEVKLQEPWMTVTIGLVPHAIEAPQNLVTVTAKLKESAPPDCTRIRLVPLFTTGDSFDAKVVNDRFTISQMKPGEYISVLISSKGICHTALVSIGLGSPMLSITVP